MTKLCGRFSSDFKFEKFIGRGSYAMVFQAIHNVDGCSYAIKRITVSKNKNAEVKREVECLARLQHKNVNRYYTSWFEQIPESNLRQLDMSSLQKPLTARRIAHEHVNDNATTSAAAGHLKFSADIETIECQAEELALSGSRSDCQVRAVTSGNELKAQHEMQTVTELNEDSTDQAVTEDGAILLLYIQLELCDRTLKQWLEQTANPDRRTAMMYFCDILQGMQHIHSLGYIHRDLKTTNVLLTFEPNSRAVVSDFGQAVSAPKGLPTSLTNFDQGSYTKPKSQPYTAAQVKNRETIENGQRLDLCNLGIILLQLIYPVRSADERHKLVDDASAQPPKLPPLVSMEDSKLLLSMLNTEEPLHASKLLNCEMLMAFQR